MMDRYTWGWTEQGHEPEVIQYCEHCGAELYEGQQGMIDDDENYFCDYDCARKYHGIEEISDTEEVDVECCPMCGEELLPEKYEVYKNGWSEFFCSTDCAELEAGLKSITIEKEKEY